MKTALSTEGGAESGARTPAKPDIEPGLASLIDAWPALPEAIRTGILAMVRAAGGQVRFGLVYSVYVYESPGSPEEIAVPQTPGPPNGARGFFMEVLRQRTGGEQPETKGQWFCLSVRALRPTLESQGMARVEWWGEE